MSDGGKGSGRRPENSQLLNANWDAVFGVRLRPEGFVAVVNDTETVVTLGKWKKGVELPEAAND